MTDPNRYPRRLLLAVTGLSPQVVTETLYALAVKREPAFVPTEVVLVTTAEGAERVRLSLLSHDPGWFGRLVLGKLKGQTRLLRLGLDTRPDLRHPLIQALDLVEGARERILRERPLPIASLRGIEGAAAAAYFKGFGRMLPESLGFGGRNRRPPRDPGNAVLSLGYTLLHFEAVRACYGAGLDPMIGFFHEIAFGRESLAADLIEPLRPRVDAWAWEQFRLQVLRAEDFRREAEACLLDKRGRQRFYGEFEALARPLRRLLRRFSGRLAAVLADAGAATIT